MSGLVKDNIFRSSGSIVEAAGGLSWQPVVVSPTGATLTVTVQSVGGNNKYFIDGVQQDTLSLKEGFTYKFDQADSSNSGHPLRFSTTSGGSHSGGSEYTTGVTTSGTPGSSGAYTQIVVASGAPVLYYYCTAHSGMGGTANTVSASVSVGAGKGYFINTTDGTITIELPSSAEAGDQIILVDYARTWGTNAVTIDSNGLNFQGEDDSYIVDYDTAGQSLNLVYSGATVGWTPSSDIVNALEPVAPLPTKGIFAFGTTGSVTNLSNLLGSNGVIAADVTGVGTSRSNVGTTTYGTDKALFAYGRAGSPYLSMKNLVSNNGVVAADVTGVGTEREGCRGMAVGSDGAAVIAFGAKSGSRINISSTVNSVGVISSDVTGVGTARQDVGASRYGVGLGIFAFGSAGGSNIFNTRNLVNTSGVVASDASGAGTARTKIAAACYGSDKGVFAYGTPATSVKNLCSNTGVIAADVSGVGKVRRSLAAATYDSDKVAFAYGFNDDDNANLNVKNLCSNTGVISADVTGVGTAREDLGATSYSIA